MKKNVFSKNLTYLIGSKQYLFLTSKLASLNSGPCSLKNHYESKFS